MTHSDSTPRFLPIGELSRASGLTVSALRFYDREGLLVPAEVDPQTGYRRYSPSQVRSARLLAGMRRVGMPLAEMAAALGALPDAEVVEDLLDAHVRRLEVGLEDARREVERLHALLPGAPAGWWTARVTAGDLARALGTVRYAVATDPDFPMLGGILVEAMEDALRLVATDRYRLALAEAPATLSAPADAATRTALLPAVVAYRLGDALTALEPDRAVRLRLSRTRFGAAVDDALVLEEDCIDLDFPDYRRLLHETAPGTHRVPTADILTALADQAVPGPARVVLHPGGVTAEGGAAEGGGLVLDRTFLWEAAAATPEGHAVLPLGNQIGPLAFHGPDDALVAMVMPVHPEPGR